MNTRTRKETLTEFVKYLRRVGGTLNFTAAMPYIISRKRYLIAKLGLIAPIAS